MMPSSWVIHAWLFPSQAKAYFYEDAQEQTVFQEDLISSGSKHHVIITQSQLRYEKQL